MPSLQTKVRSIPVRKEWGEEDRAAAAKRDAAEVVLVMISLFVGVVFVLPM